jgi:hypothetical protein
MQKEFNCPAKLRFAEDFHKTGDNYMIFQIDDHILNELKKTGVIEIKGTKIIIECKWNRN